MFPPRTGARAFAGPRCAREPRDSARLDFSSDASEDDDEHDDDDACEAANVGNTSE